MGNLRGVFGVRRIDKVSNPQIREFCGVTKGIDERIEEGVLLWFCHMEGMENVRIAKRVYVGERAGSRLVGRPRKKWIDIVKDCSRKRSLNVRQARRMVQDRSEWRRFLRGEGMHGA